MKQILPSFNLFLAMVFTMMFFDAMVATDIRLIVAYCIIALVNFYHVIRFIKP